MPNELNRNCVATATRLGCYERVWLPPHDLDAMNVCGGSHKSEGIPKCRRFLALKRGVREPVNNGAGDCPVLCVNEFNY